MLPDIPGSVSRQPLHDSRAQKKASSIVPRPSAVYKSLFAYGRMSLCVFFAWRGEKYTQTEIGSGQIDAVHFQPAGRPLGAGLRKGSRGL
jgi:hypothetical protein